MTLQITLLELRKVIHEKINEIITDTNLAEQLYRKIIEIEDDERFIEVKDE